MGSIFTTQRSTTAGGFTAKRDMGAVLVGTFGFFVGRAVVFGFINPLGLPFLAAFMGAGHAFYMTGLLVVLGMMTRLGDWFTLRYIFAVVLLCGYHFMAMRVTSSRGVRPWLALPFAAAAVSGAMLVSGIAFALLYGPGMFLFAVTVLEAVMAGAMTLVVKRGHVILTGRRKRTSFLSGEDIISLTVILAGVIAGASEIYVGAMPLRIFFCVYVLSLVGYKGGVAMAAAAGMLLGLFLHLAGHWDTSMVAVLSLAGMGSGFAKRWGRIASVAGVAAAGAAGLFVLERGMLGFAPVYAVIAAGLAFMLTPQGFYFNVASAISPVLDSADDYMDKIKEETTRRLDSFSHAFEKLADTFSGLSKPKTSLNKHDISLLIDDLAARACHSCPRQGYCWEDNLYATHQQIFALLNACAQKGAADPHDLDASFRKSCLSPDAWLTELNATFNLYKNNLRWHNRIAESRDLVSQQLHGVAGIVKCLSEEIDMSLKFHEGLEEEMIMALLKSKIDVNSVIVLEDKQQKYRVTVNHRPCDNNKSCVFQIIPALNAVLKRRMRLESSTCCHSGTACSVRFIEDQKFRLTTGVAHRAKTSRASGDSYSCLDLKNGNSLMVLSDGMGSGERARRESAATVGLLEDFIESGFDKELAVKMINSVLVLKSNEESFSTLDICSVDLYTGEAEFIKIGAAATFILRDGHVKTIRSSSLPIGMLGDVDLEVTNSRLQPDDVIIMATDGIADSDDEWLFTTLRECHTRYGNPQDMADHILKEAIRAAGGTPRDDITVLAARVWAK